MYRQFSELQPRPFDTTSWRNFHAELIEIRYLIWATFLYPFVLPRQRFTMQIDFLQSPVPSCTRVLMGQSIWLVMFQPLYSTARNYTHVDSRNFFTAGPCRECVNIWESGHVATRGHYGGNAPPLFSSRHQNPWTRFPRRTSGSVNFRKQGRARAPNNNLRRKTANPESCQITAQWFTASRSQSRRWSGDKHVDVCGLVKSKSATKVTAQRCCIYFECINK